VITFWISDQVAAVVTEVVSPDLSRPKIGHYIPDSDVFPISIITTPPLAGRYSKTRPARVASSVMRSASCGRDQVPKVNVQNTTLGLLKVFILAKKFVRKRFVQ
jgi:hypothetical protein